MISTIPFIIWFIIYVIYTIITFDIYSKKEGRTNPLILIIIFIYYSIIIGYIINLIDIDANFFEKSIEILIYLFAGSFFIYSHYIISIKNIEDEKYGNSNNSNIDRI